MQNSKSPNHNWLFLLWTRQYNLRRPTREVGPTLIARSLLQFTNGIKPSLLAMHLHICIATHGNVICLGCHLAKSHDPIHQTVNDLESARRSRVRGAHLPYISGTHDCFCHHMFTIGNHHIANFKELEPPREGHGLIMLKALQQSWQKGGTYHLVLDIGRIAQAHGRGDWAFQRSEVIMCAAQSMGQDFDISPSANLLAKQISELIQGLFPTHRARLGNSFGNVVVPVSDANVLSDVDGVEDVRSRGGNSHLNDRALLIVIAR
mmetsp:Transcript_17107/g.36128  ORF Transcript_17107/g.36128 Transcript_17107/m.36128 type:complete len:263 (-) Transcript_17107:1176-1964(-)